MTDVVKPPNSLYKYMSLKKIEWIEEVVINHKIFFSSPFDFNDPFDCCPRVVMGRTKMEQEDVLKWIEKKLTKLGLDRSSRRVRSREILKNANKIGTNNIKEDFKNILGKAGVYCTSAKNDSLLMWSHYGESHAGLCFEFSTTNNDFFSHAKEIHYDSTYPVVKLFFEKEDQSKKVYLTKSDHWKYEEEWRLFSKEPGHLNIPSNALVSIILGCKMSKQNRDKVLDICARAKSTVKLVQAKMHSAEYGLQFADL